MTGEITDARAGAGLAILLNLVRQPAALQTPTWSGRNDPVDEANRRLRAAVYGLLALMILGAALVIAESRHPGIEARFLPVVLVNGGLIFQIRLAMRGSQPAGSEGCSPAAERRRTLALIDAVLSRRTKHVDFSGRRGLSEAHEK